MSSQARGPGSADMLGATLLFSLLLHGLVVLGISFAYPKPKARLPALDVTLLNTANQKAPDKADFLAQANNQGGGESDQAHRPSQPFSTPLPKPDPGIAPRPIKPSAPAPSEASQTHRITTTGNSPQHVASSTDRHAHPQTDLQRDRVAIQRRLEMARLAAQIRAERSKLAKRPKIKYINSSTRQYAYAAYMQAWASRVERVGTLNFPDAARTGRYSGSLILTVVLRRDGSIKRIAVIESSGRKVLDDAAMRIVRMAAPFPPIPRTGEHYDELNITRTYQFLHGGTLQTH
ncbi:MULTISPECIES: TonB family protein [Oleiagrimonas]|nr:TonB family protein [Oleiagrimonas sp. MCCC 1A03011]RAP58556.1 energy transducer TonB [Oleiagrimonas sp. MCCC 1A03011]